MTARTLIEAKRPNTAGLSVAELQKIYLNDYTGNMGLKRAVDTGPHGDDREYLALFFDDQSDEWIVSRIYVGMMQWGTGYNKGDAPPHLAIDFAGSPVFSGKDQAEAERFFERESHVAGGGDVKIPPKPEPRRFPPNGDRPYQAPPGHVAWSYRRPSSGDSPHWDGNRYAL